MAQSRNKGTVGQPRCLWSNGAQRGGCVYVPVLLDTIAAAAQPRPKRFRESMLRSPQSDSSRSGVLLSRSSPARQTRGLPYTCSFWNYAIPLHQRHAHDGLQHSLERHPRRDHMKAKTWCIGMKQGSMGHAMGRTAALRPATCDAETLPARQIAARRYPREQVLQLAITCNSYNRVI